MLKRPTLPVSSMAKALFRFCATTDAKTDARLSVSPIPNTRCSPTCWLLSEQGDKRVSQPHHTPSFAFVIRSRQALLLLEQITPYLRTYKRSRAELLLRSYLSVTPRNGRYTATVLAARRAFEEQFFAISSRCNRA